MMSINRKAVILFFFLAGSSLVWSQEGRGKQQPLPPGGLPELIMQQAGNSPLAISAALRWRLLEEWAKMPDLDGTGPFATTYEEVSSTVPFVVYRPKDVPAAAGRRKLGVYIWGNGGCSGDSVREARFHLTEIASHGYVAIAPGKLLSGPRAPKMSDQEREKIGGENRATAAKMIAALDWIMAENARKGSPYAGAIDPARVTVAGNSCGGLIAMTAAQDPRVKAIIMTNSGLFAAGNAPGRGGRAGGGQPAAGAPPAAAPQAAAAALPSNKEDLAKLHTPVLYIVGGPEDTAEANALDDFKKIDHVPVFLATQPGAGHIGTFHEPRGEDTKLEMDWMKWQFDNDHAAARTFVGPDCTLCTDYRWVVYRKRIE
jgi:dienelactone hydrolase